jgi:hypothetical protein
MTALWIHEVAERFWADGGGPLATFPRDLREAATWALAVGLVTLPDLSISSVDAWLAQRDSQQRLLIPDRLLRACMVVHEGNGILFIDATDPEDEQRFSLAHEIAHFLVEYAVPRERAQTRLGPGIVPVLHGHRAPSAGERIGALLSGVSLTTCLHLMERTPDGHRPGREVSEAERRADELAFELLAPFEAVRAALPDGASAAIIEDLLMQAFGLPAAPARDYARQLAPEPPAGSLFRALFSVP